jgi:hypothetical protein
VIAVPTPQIDACNSCGVVPLQAVANWKFTPTLLNGRAVPIVMTVTVAFALTK